MNTVKRPIRNRGALDAIGGPSHATPTPGAPEPPCSHASSQGRREQNRQSQHAFRQRRKAAEDAQRRRIRQLEVSVEEMGNVLVGLCDEMLGAMEVARHPRLMARLQSSMARALQLAKTSSADDEGDTTPEMEEERCDKPVSLRLSIPVPHPPPAAASFAVRLVEITLARACLYLAGDAYISPSNLERSFGHSLRARSRAELLADLRWLLARGDGALREAAAASGGALPEYLTADGVQKQLRGLGARDLDPDTMELRIRGGGGALKAGMPALVIRLRTSLLTDNLSLVAVCVDRAPVCPRHEVQKAVEASVVLAEGP